MIRTQLSARLSAPGQSLGRLLDLPIASKIALVILTIVCFAAIFAPVVKRDPRPVWHSSAARPVSNRPPVQTPAEIAAGQTDVLPQDQAAAANSEHPAEAFGELPPDATPDV